MRGSQNNTDSKDEIMRILSITAQKPNSTGSGVYLTELVKEYALMGHEQAVIAGIYQEDPVELPGGVKFYPVYFENEKLPYPIVGMSDEMPYRSTRYCDMTPEMTEKFEAAFLEAADEAVREFEPELILCHHLYLLTAILRKRYPMHCIYGFCHNTDLRQMVKTAILREFIREQIPKLDRIFVPQEAQREGVLRIYGAAPEKIEAVGMGYNNKIFFPQGVKGKDGVTRIVFAGKIAEKKGVMSLIRSLSILYEKEGRRGKDKLVVRLAGSAGNREEYERIRSMAQECPYEIHFLGRLAQTELAKVYNESDIFVLPSFFDGLPLTIIEALACGDRVVVSDLPGIKDWIEAYTRGADVRYVPMPQMRNADEPAPESLPEFEERLAEALLASIRTGECRKEEESLAAGGAAPAGSCKRACGPADVSRISWEGIAKKVVRRRDEDLQA